MVDWSQCPVVESDPQRVHAAWVFRNTRLPVSIVFECIARGATIDSLRSHAVETTAERGWDRLTNSKLLEAAEADGFEILTTADKGFQHQQNLRHRRIGVVILSRGNWPDVRRSIPKILDAIKAATGGTCTFVECLTSFIEEDTR